MCSPTPRSRPSRLKILRMLMSSASSQVVVEPKVPPRKTAARSESTRASSCARKLSNSWRRGSETARVRGRVAAAHGQPSLPQGPSPRRRRKELREVARKLRTKSSFSRSSTIYATTCASGTKSIPSRENTLRSSSHKTTTSRRSSALPSFQRSRSSLSCRRS